MNGARTAPAAGANMTEIEPINYERKTAEPSVPRVWGLSRPVWLLLAAFCGFVEFARAFATNGRVNGWGDLAFILVFAVLGVMAFVNALRLLWRAGKSPAPQPY